MEPYGFCLVEKAMRDLIAPFIRPVLFVVLTTILFVIVKFGVIGFAGLEGLTQLTVRITGLTPDGFIWRLSVILLLALLGMKMRYAERDAVQADETHQLLPMALRPVVGTLAVCIALYAFFAPLPPAAQPQAGDQLTLTIYDILRYCLPVLAIASFWRPMAALPVVATLFWQHAWITYLVMGIRQSHTDYFPVFDTLLFVLSGIMLWQFIGASRRFTILPRLSRLRQFVLSEAGQQPKSLHLLELVLIVMIGIHLGNYFHSGIAKLELSGGPFVWVLENPTYQLAHAALELGTFPFASWPNFTGSLLEFSEGAGLYLINWLTLGFQLLCLFAVLRRRWLLIMLLAFDVQHIGIFLLTGVMFWKWIAINTACVLALRYLPLEKFDRPTVLLSAAGLVLALPIFFVARLGWYDTNALNQMYAVAELQDGRQVRLPSNYFGPFSVNMAQGDFAFTLPDMLVTGTMGTTMSVKDMRLGKENCTQMEHGAELNPRFGPTQLEQFSTYYHGVALALADKTSGRLDYDYYPHHIWSVPWLYKEAQQMDVRQIVAYRWQFVTVCADWTGGQRQSQELSRRELVVPVVDGYKDKSKDTNRKKNERTK
jgi:hypothetical protein